MKIFAEYVAEKSKIKFSMTEYDRSITQMCNGLRKDEKNDVPKVNSTTNKNIEKYTLIRCPRKMKKRTKISMKIRN